VAIAKIQTTTGTALTGNPSATSWTPTNGNLLVVAVFTRNTGITVSLAGNGQTWVATPTPSKTADRGQQEMHTFYVIASGASTGSIVATLSASTLPSVIIAIELSGTDAATPIEVDSYLGTGGTDNATATGSLTTLTDNAWFLQFIDSRSGTVTGLDGTLTSDVANTQVGAGGNVTTGSLAHKNVSPAGAASSSSTLDAVRDWITYTASIKPASAVGGNVIPTRPARIANRNTGPMALRHNFRPAYQGRLADVQAANAIADVATIQFESNQPTVGIGAVAGLANITFAAQTPAASVGVNAGNAPITFAAVSPTVKVGQAGLPSTATITFAANAPTPKVQPNVGLASVDFRANQVSVSNLTVVSLLQGGRDSASDYINYLQTGSLKIKSTSDRRNSTMDFQLIGSSSDAAFNYLASWPIELENVIQFQYGTEVKFSGRVRSVKPFNPVGKAGYVGLQVGCQDWTGLATDNIIDSTLASGVRTTVESDKARIAWLFGTFYLDPAGGDWTWGLDYATNVATTLASMPSQDFTGMTLGQALDAITDITGAVWYIDFGTSIGSAGSGVQPNPTLRYFIPDPTIALTTPFGVAATDTLTSTAHGMSAGQAVIFDTLQGGTGLSIGPIYYVIASGLTANAFKLSATLGGSAVNFTTDITLGTLIKVTAAAFGLSDTPDNVTTYGFMDLHLSTESTEKREGVLIQGGNGYQGTFGNLREQYRSSIIKDTSITDATAGAVAAAAFLNLNGIQTTGSLTTRQTGLAPGTYVQITATDQGTYGANLPTQTYRITTLETSYPWQGNIIYRVTFGTVPRLLHTAVKDIVGDPLSIAQNVVAGVLKGYIGEIIGWPLASPPTGFLICDGSSLLRTTYASLFAVIGTTFGAADGTHFNLPNFTDRFPLGVGAKALAATGGSLGHTHTGPAHTHTGAAHTHTQPTHTHTTSAHTHTGPSHTHAGPSHNHDLPFLNDDSANVLHVLPQSVFGSGSSQTADYKTAALGSSGSSAPVASSGSASGTTGTGGTGATGSGGGGTTGADGNDDTGSSGSGATSSSGTGATGTADPPYLAIYFAIRYA
jgi:microcystin-dependent protein